MTLATYNETFNTDLIKLDSILNEPSGGDKLNFLDGLETTLTELLQEGKMGASGNSGMELSVDKGNKIATWTFTTFIDATDGVRKIVLGNLVPSLDVYFNNTIRSRITGNSAGGEVYLYDNASNVVGRLYGDTSGLHLYAQDTDGDMELLLASTANNTGNFIPSAGYTVNLGTALAEYNNAFFDGTVQTDALRIDQTPTVEVNTATHYATVDFNGTNYKVLLKSV